MVSWQWKRGNVSIYHEEGNGKWDVWDWAEIQEEVQTVSDALALLNFVRLYSAYCRNTFSMREAEGRHRCLRLTPLSQQQPAGVLIYTAWHAPSFHCAVWWAFTSMIKTLKRCSTNRENAILVFRQRQLELKQRVTRSFMLKAELRG